MTRQQSRPFDQSDVIYLLDRRADHESVLKLSQDDEAATGGGSLLCCAACLRLVTRAGNAIERGGQQIQTFFNPAGMAFTIGCFHQASCLVVGELTEEWSWYPGYAWQYGLCSQCQTHLGWYFQHLDAADHFYGLIMDRLVMEEE